MKKLFVNLFLILMSIIFFGSCSDSDDGSGQPYDPSKPTELLTFFPDSGKYLEKVILTGKNFGTDTKDVKVYFNSKRAAVVGSTGTQMYVLAPRLPGDTCIISVVIGNDSISYPDFFRYRSSVTVTTIAGNGNKDDFKEGSLGETILQPRYLCVDKDDNIFVLTRNDGDKNQHVLRINEEEDLMSIVARDVTGNVPAADPETGMISFPTETTLGSFYTLDPREFWAPRFRDMKWPEGAQTPPNGWKHSMVVNPEDGYIYTRYYNGEIVKIHPRSYEVEVLHKTQQGDSYGLTFNPLKPNVLYLSFWGNAGDNAHSICSMDVLDPENTFKRISSSVISGGHRDGELSAAQFRDPCQIFCDNDGNIYVADSGNHCIRRITSEDAVETTLGMPGSSGWKDGSKEEALFNTPRGIGIGSDGSVYVADYGNARVRKLSIN